mmetsp:Transcript_22027/g.55550  ORF Transcript_22027/g.55550 Transcript_22027/m.55550 type:complete len:343 (-) Transcript_22027:2472-3500(-)
MLDTTPVTAIFADKSTAICSSLVASRCASVTVTCSSSRDFSFFAICSSTEERCSVAFFSARFRFSTSRLPSSFPDFFAFGSYLSWMTSRLCTARSISLMICSCRRFSCSSRSCIRWISFFIAVVSSSPTDGSSACCISCSRWIFRCHSMICFSASMVSSSICAFSRFISSMWPSILVQTASMSLSFATNSCSEHSASLTRVAAWDSYLAIWPFMRSMSCFNSRTLCSNCFTSLSIASTSRSLRIFFCSNIIFLCFMSAMAAFTLSAAACSSRILCCRFSHSFCCTAHAADLSAICLRSERHLASRGPEESTASPNSSSSRLLLSSYSRLRRSTKSCFFSICR